MKFFRTHKKDNFMMNMDKKEFKVGEILTDLDSIYLICLIEDNLVLKKEKLN